MKKKGKWSKDTNGGEQEQSSLVCTRLRFQMNVWNDKHRNFK